MNVTLERIRNEAKALSPEDRELLLVAQSAQNPWIWPWMRSLLNSPLTPGKFSGGG